MKDATKVAAPFWAWFRFESWNVRLMFLIYPFLGVFLGWLLLRIHSLGVNVGGSGGTLAVITISFLDAIFYVEFYASRRSGTLEFPFVLAISRKKLYWAKTILAFMILASLCLPIMIGGLLSNQGPQGILFGLVWMAVISICIPLSFFIRRFSWWRIYAVRWIMMIGLFMGILYGGFSWASARPETFYVTILPFGGVMLWLGERLFVQREVTD
jgi:hypothetical protein